MKIEKIHLDDMKRCYCASNITFDNENHILLASEDPDVACNMYNTKRFYEKTECLDKTGRMHVHYSDSGKRKRVYCRTGILSESQSESVKAGMGEDTNEKDEWEFKDVVFSSVLSSL